VPSEPMKEVGLNLSKKRKRQTNLAKPILVPVKVRSDVRHRDAAHGGQSASAACVRDLPQVQSGSKLLGKCR
jgi:hypothetical protein